ncbi:hypothetical protein [Hahella sp. HN01]|uniref:hypothetical protein n=1 Tax=Hahella sp. HN01 TaxID=2847262 RepID=UPI001C1F0EC7|nr:hypothetical protein [Hahella sp. HN01]MBU6951353.1 hypothetical protein [Hahella sp. HN01]
MPDGMFDEIGGLDDPEWILKHCLYKLFTSPRALEKVDRFIKEGYVAGELNWSIQKWSDEVGEEFEVEPYEGFMAFLGGDEHGYYENDEYSIFHNDEVFYSRLASALDWYASKHPEKSDVVDRLKVAMAVGF